MDTVQVNVRVAESDRPLIVQVALKLRSDPGFRERLAALLEDRPNPVLEERIKALEHQISTLLSGASAAPLAAAGPAVRPPSPALPRMPPPKAPPSAGPLRVSPARG
jgi:hypothetical protein